MMTNEEINVAVTRRFFTALETLKKQNVIRGLMTFSERYGYDRRNMVLQRRELERDRLRPSWLVHLVEDYKVNPTWLMLGKGDFYMAGFDAEIVKKLQKNRE